MLVRVLRVFGPMLLAPRLPPILLSQTYGILDRQWSVCPDVHPHNHRVPFGNRSDDVKRYVGSSVREHLARILLWSGPLLINFTS